MENISRCPSLTEICRVEEVKTKAILEAWYKSLDLIVALLRSKVIPGRLGQGWEPDTKADLAHNRKNLDLFAEKITYGKQKPQVDELFQTSKAAFPQVCISNFGRRTDFAKLI